jgi:hypothetical protein
MPTKKNLELKEFPTHGSSKGISDEELLKQLRSAHPLYQEFLPRWQFFLAAYEGGEDFTSNSSHLFKHFRENEEDYSDRLKRAHYINYCEVLVDYYTNFIFSEPIDRNGGSNSELYRDFMKDVNKRGDNIDTFMRTVCEDSQVFGMSYIFVDAPKKDGGLVTKFEEQQNGIRPYWVLVKPEEVIHWAIDEFGRYTYLKRRQLSEEFDGSKVRVYEIYTEYTFDTITITKVDVTDKSKPEIFPSEPLPNELGRIPIVAAKWKKSKLYPNMGKSFLTDFAANNREIYNLTSLLDEFLYRQAFNILVMQTDGQPAAEGDETVLGPSNVLEYPKGANAPAYIYPSSDTADKIQDERGRIKNEMFARAAQDTVNEIFNGEKSSGFSQAQSFSKTVPFISARADMLEAVENELMALTMEMMGKTWDGKVKYKDRYELTNLTDALTQLQVLVRDLHIPSETFVKEQLKRMVREYDGKLPVETLAKIEKEIEEMSFKSWQSTQKEALVGKGVSPGEQQKPKSTGTMAEAAKEAQGKTGGTNKLKPPKAA